MGAGKSVIARLLARTLDLPAVLLDEIRWPYYLEKGFDPWREIELRERGGARAVLEYRAPFDVDILERVFGDHQRGVFALGAGHIGVLDEERRERLESLLAGFRHVLLLLPDPDLETSIAELARRLEDDPDSDLALNRQLVRNARGWNPATHTIDTPGRRPEQTCAEIAALSSEGQAL